MTPEIRKAVQSGLPALIELRYDGCLLTPNESLEAIRQTAQATARK
jgi:hypothetical protein